MIRVSSIYLSAYAKADIRKYWNTRRSACHFDKRTHQLHFELGKGDPCYFVLKQDRSFVFMFLDRFNLLRGLKLVDEIKKCRRGSLL